MNNRLLTSALYLIAFIFLYSCKDIIETDLSKKSLGSLAPADNIVSSSYHQTFRWDPIDGATSYKLQIAKPNFAAPTAYFLDSTIKTNQFTSTLTPGVYQWRVKAMNSSSYTPYITHNLTIDSSLDLHNQFVLLSTPANNMYSNNLTSTFSWQILANSNSYLFQVFSNDTLIATQSSTTTSLSYSFSSQGTYTWKVSGQNTLSTSQPSSARTITVDTTKPLLPVAVFPVFDTIHANPIQLKWNTTASTGTFASSDFCRLQISRDSTFTAITTDGKDTVMRVGTNPMIYSFYGATVGQNYYWRVKAMDNADNSSAYFIRRRLKRN